MSTPAATSENGNGKPGRVARLWKWIDQRTGVDKTLRRSLDEPIPGGARFAYVFGSALLFLFVSQIVTGLCLALYYVPTPAVAHVTVAYIVKDVAAGAFLRSLHSYGSSAMVVVLLLHFLQTVLYGSYKGKRQLLWIAGCVLALLVVGMTFTGYLLSWDQSGYSAGSVGTNIVGQVPFIGDGLRRLLRGGSAMGALTLSRFYVLHLFVIPALLLSFIAAHLVMFRKAGAAGPVHEDPVKPHLPTELFYPKQVLIDMAFVLLVMGVLGMLAHFVPVALGLEADPSNTTYLPRPEWYFRPMFQWLKYWEGKRTVIGVVVIPAVLVGLVFLLPFMDRGSERRPWRRPIPVGGVLLVLIGALWLGMTSRLDDQRDASVAAQLAQQDQQEAAYVYSPFRPYSESTTSDSSGASATATAGKGIFDSHGCSTCHGASGGGAKGPPLTHITSKYQLPQLTALLQAPTAAMKAGGMVPLTLSTAEFTALHSYLTSLEGPAGAGAAQPKPAARTSLEGPAGAGAAQPKPAAPAPPSSVTPGTSKVTSHTSSAPSTAADKAPSKALSGAKSYESLGCPACHGAGGQGTQKAPALTDVGKKLSTAGVASLLREPTPKMKAGGMPPVTLTGQELTSLVAYVRGLGGTGKPQALGTEHTSTTKPPSPSDNSALKSAPLPAAPTAAEPVAQPNASADQAGGSHPSGPPTDQRGESIFKTHGCAACHGAAGIGTVRAPALAKLEKSMTAASVAQVLQHPTHAMQAGGMPAIDLKPAELTALVEYLRSLATPANRPSGASVPSAGGLSVKAPRTPLNDLESKGQSVFMAHECATCHGTNGVGGTAAAPALAGTGATLTPATLTAVLQHPSVRMRQGGMPPVSVSGDQLKQLVAYVIHIAAATP